jgi:hypothetical protein
MAQAVLLLIVQIGSLPIMLSLAAAGRSLYGSGSGAYIYDLPVPLQAFHVFAVVVMVSNYTAKRTGAAIALLAMSAVLFLYFTWLMREVSMFRGSYVTGVMIAGIAVLQQLKGRVGYAWLILPIVAAQPFFAQLGETRNLRNEDLSEEGVSLDVNEDKGVLEAYWQVYNAHGDMNIFDTFVAAKQNEPRFRPYLWSWIYVPLHIIPRALWPGKPERGVTQDISYNRGAPLSPGIVGFFMRDGGLLWMLGSMFLLGYLIALLDWYIQTMPRGYLRCCLISITVINAMYLTRFYLWQYFYQVLYAAIPCIVLAWYLKTQWSGTPRRRVSGTAKRGALVGPAE